MGGLVEFIAIAGALIMLPYNYKRNELYVLKQIVEKIHDPPSHYSKPLKEVHGIMTLEFHYLIHTLLNMCPCKIKLHGNRNEPCAVEELS